MAEECSSLPLHGGYTCLRRLRCWLHKQARLSVEIPEGNDKGIFCWRGKYPSAARLPSLMFVKHPEILGRKGPIEWKVLLLLLRLWLLWLIYFIKALYYLIRCFRDKGLKKFANTGEVRLSSHPDGGERVVSSAVQREAEAACVMTCRRIPVRSRWQDQEKNPRFSGLLLPF